MSEEWYGEDVQDTPEAPERDVEVQEDAPDILTRLNAIEAAQMAQGKVLEGIRDGVNTIGGMMNDVADAFGQIMDQVSKGGIGALLGGMMGKKNNGD